MYVCNLIGESVLGEISRGKGLPFINNVEEGSPVEGYVTVKDNKLIVSQEGENLFTKSLQGSLEDLYNPFKGQIKSYKPMGLTYGDIADTEENPLIIVLCKEIKVYEGIPAGLKYIYMNDNCILACLLYGMCEFDGIPMQRCCVKDAKPGSQAKVLTGATFSSMSKCVDSETEYSYLRDIVNQVEILVKNSTSGVTSSFKTAISAVTWFDMSGLEEAKQIKAERDAKIEALRRKKAEEEEQRRAYYDKIEAERKEKELADVLATAGDAKKSKSTKAKTSKEPTETINLSASAFLSIATSVSQEG